MKIFFHKNRTTFAMTLTTLLLGLLVGLQFKDVYKSNKLLLHQKNQNEVYEAMLNKEKDLFNELSAKYDEAIQKNEELLQTGSEKEKTKNLNDKLAKAKFLAGYTDVKGEGVVIVLDDAQKDELDANPEGLSDHIVHYNDVLRVLNTLKINGAQAISINDERILSSSSQICSGSTISINQNKYVLPYTIKAIGDSQRMYDGFKESEIYNELVFFKMRADISMEKEIFIKAGVFK